ncbi:MAG TPA: HD domain-containing protein [Candidatus Omnitrophota bacterium]|nr:HD domain-containing protein [Candidatus Omnitrophota bacterium]HPT38708.1 HD domain-containing protein [Candidatus Omnitrophota bacterium]
MLKFAIKEQNILNPIYNFAKTKKVKLYLVGGALRDLILGRSRENPDFDFCLKSGALKFGEKLAGLLHCAFIVLDQENATCRLVKKIDQKIYTFDFSDFRASTLEKDLLHRDFTVNSMAVNLEDIFGGQDLGPLIIDPYGGRVDLKSKIIKVTGESSFKEDPLRILRAFSFGCMLGFGLDKKTLSLAKKEKAKISAVSGERIREELFKILDSAMTYNCLVSLDKLKILEIIFPEIKPMRKIGQGPHHHLDVWQHTLETLNQFESVVKEAKKTPAVFDYLQEEIAGLRKRTSLLKLACILHDVGKPKALRYEKKKIIFHGHERIGLGLTREISRRLKLSNEENRHLGRIVLWHLRPGYLAANPHPTARAIFRYFRDTGSDALAVLLLSLADQRATKGPKTSAFSRLRHEQTVKTLIRKLLKQQEEKKPERFLTGFDLMKKFKLPASPLIGKLLSELEEAQAIGKIKNKLQAYQLAAKIIKSRK